MTGNSWADNICLEHGGMLIDKYIGLRYPQARELDLYFVSWLRTSSTRAGARPALLRGWLDRS